MRRLDLKILKVGALLLATGCTTLQNAPSSETSATQQQQPEAPILAPVFRALSHITSNRYVLRGNLVDPDAGMYEVDCSGFVNYYLERSAPKSLASVASLSPSHRPLVKHYYEAFTSPALDPNGWTAVTKIEDLAAGDLIAIRYNESYRASHHIRSTGHIMIVLSAPRARLDASDGSFAVDIADSARSPHGGDSRLSQQTGIGRGIILLRSNNEHRVTYAWSPESSWIEENPIALARPIPAKSVP